MLTRLLKHVVDLVLPESQSGFWCGCSTIDMIFVARQLLEKCCEQHQDLYLALVDLTKAFDTVNRDLLWNILRKFGCPPTLIAILRQFHTGMCAQVVMAGSQSSSFPVEVGVKQGCVLAPIIFNLLLVAITLVSHCEMQSSDCVGIEYRLDGGLFNLQRLQAKTKTTSAMISALQYIDDAAFPSLTADGLQRSFDVMSETYLCAGLIINTTKTEILSTPSPDAPTFSISGNQLKNSENFIYFSSNLSFYGDLINEIQRRINLASSAFGRLSKHVFGNQNFTIHTKIAVYNAVVISTILYCCESWVPYRRHIRLLESFHIRRLQLILGLRWWHKVTHSEIRSWAGIPTIESMLPHRHLHWLGHVIIMPHSRLPHCMLYGQIRLGHRSVGGQKNRLKDHIKSIIVSATFLLAGWRLLHPTELPGDLPVPLECHTLTMHTIELQLSDAVAYISMHQCSAQFRILFINAHFVADNASHALASSATVKPTFNVEEEVVVIRNGWIPQKKI